jgi:hypothetical protein
LAEFVESKGTERKSMVFEKCPDKAASIDFSIKATLVSESISGDTLS